MRTAFIEQLIVEARRNPKLFLVVGDLGFSVVEPFAAEFPERFLNAGVAEQNMTGVAAGLASEGYHVFTYSIGNFPTLRCLEQIRNDICYHNFPVTVVAVGAGMSYGNLGYSHHCVQDIAALRGLPGITILSPADPNEARQCVRWLSQNPGPSYLRLGKAGEPSIHDKQILLEGPTLIVDHEAELCIVGTGSILAEAVSAAESLATQDIKADVLSLTKVNPVDVHDFANLLRYKKILTIEEHVPAGGIGELLKSMLPRTVKIESLALENSLTSKVGSQRYLRVLAKLDEVAITDKIIKWMADE
jgi:transketolase